MNGGRDAIVIGAGHNGLTCAAYLARAGRRVLVVEAAERTGGMVERAHLVHALDARVARDLALGRHGLVWTDDDVVTRVVGADGSAAYRLSDHRGEALSACAPADTRRWSGFVARLHRFGELLGDLARRPPPALGGNRHDLVEWLRIGLRVRRLGRAELREFLRIAAINVFDVLEEYFESPLLKAGLAADAVLGHRLGPRSPNSMLTLLMRVAGSVNGRRGALAMARDGTLGTAFEAAARGAGVEIRVAAPVRRIVVDDDRVAGVELDGGEFIAAPLVVSGADPVTTCLELLGSAHLDTGLVRRLRHVRRRGICARVDLVVAALPPLPADDRAAGRCRLLFADEMDAIETAFNAAKYGAHSPRPLIELVIPAAGDAAGAADGRQRLSALVQYAPFDAHDDGAGLLRAALATLEERLPGLAARTVDARIAMPAGIGAAHRCAGGHWHHAELALDQFFMLRPVPSLAGYRAPVSGLYLCGAGMHPGGGISGLPGANAARVILADGTPR